MSDGKLFVLTVVTVAAYAITQHGVLFVLLALLGFVHIVRLVREHDRADTEPVGIPADLLYHHRKDHHR